MKIRKLTNKGFTLIELLIVIIIIGILATIAIVAYSSSQNKAKQAGAQGNITNVKNKLAEYNTDHGNYPTDITNLNNWLKSSEAGNNADLASKFVNPSYTYVVTCTTSPCGDTIDASGNVTAGAAATGYTITAVSNWGGPNLTLTN